VYTKLSFICKTKNYPVADDAGTESKEMCLFATLNFLVPLGASPAT